MAQANPNPPPFLVIRPTHGLAALNLRDLWVYRELVFFMTWRDLLVRYKQTALGILWAMLQPLLQMLIFTILFSNIANLPSEGVPYPLLTLVALLPWTMFSKALGDAGRSLVTNRNMLTKIYFPRMIIPIASVLASLADFLIAFLVLLLMGTYYYLTGQFHFVPTAALWTLPLFLLLALVTALGVSLWLSALNVIYRDVGHVLPFLTQFWLFITPVGYSATVVTSPRWQVIYAINPMVGVVNGFRWALLGVKTAPDIMLVVSATVALVTLVSGLFYFRSMERTFADEI